MVEDFDDSANALWTLYVKEAKSHDEATVGTIKDDMDGVLIFVRSHTLLYCELIVLTGTSGWLVLCCPHRVYHRSFSEHTTESRTTVGVLPATINCAA
jgi:hypothetical protein